MIACDSSNMDVREVTLMEHLTSEYSGSCNVIVEHFRCPQDFMEIQFPTGLLGDTGYFKFGPNAICYGHCSDTAVQPSVNSSLHDSLPDAIVGTNKVRLTFDPNEVVRNLRMERYPIEPLTGYRSFLKKLYYLLRPLTTPLIRRQIQRFHMGGWQSKGFPHWPVDTTTEDIAERIMLQAIEAQGGEVPFIWFWPSGQQGCLLMTHDVETASGRDFCSELQKLDAAYGIAASFQVVPEGRYHTTPEFLDALRSPGFELLLQDLNHDGRLFDDRQEFLSRAKHIRRYARQYRSQGFRAGVLYRKPEWYQDLGISFDMSIPNVAHLDPQRGGCCTVFPYFIGDVLELPVTTVQDYSLFYLLNEHSIDLWKQQLELILAKYGLASFVVHPDYIRDIGNRRVYEQLLAWLDQERRKRNLWIALPSQVNQWWRDRSRMSLVRRSGEWQIQGAGAERAVLAFAQCVEGKLRYRLHGHCPSPSNL